MHSRHFFYTWCKNKNSHQDAFINQWLEHHTLDTWAKELQITDIELTTDQTGILAICSGKITTFCRDTFTLPIKFCKLHFHFNLNGYLICLGTTAIDNHFFANLPNGATNPTQIIHGKRKPSFIEATHLLKLMIQSGLSVYYSPRVTWALKNDQKWQLGEIWHDRPIVELIN